MNTTICIGISIDRSYCLCYSTDKLLQTQKQSQNTLTIRSSQEQNNFFDGKVGDSACTKTILVLGIIAPK